MDYELGLYNHLYELRLLNSFKGKYNLLALVRWVFLFKLYSFFN